MIATRDSAAGTTGGTRPGPTVRAARVLNADVPAIGAEQVARSPAAELVQDDEVVILLLRPSPLSIVLGALGSLVFIALITFVLAWMSRLAWVGWTDTMAFGFGAALALIRLSWQGLEWYCRLFILTDRRVIRRMGVLRVAVFQTKLKNIQHTSVFQSMRERVCGLGSIGFATAGSDVFEAFWTMIDKPFEIHRIIVRAIEKYG